MIYFEFSKSVVDANRAPAALCSINGHLHTLRVSKYIPFAERVFSIKGNTITEYKNRNGAPGTMHISDEDKDIFKLKAVMI